jgi:hypothetical protein
MASNVISQPSSAVAKLNAIAQIRKYKRLHEGHHFILMAMEVHDTPMCDMYCFIKECVCLLHNRRLGGHLSLSFYIQFFRQCVVLQRALTYVTKRKIVLVGDACSRPPIIIRFHNLHVGDIRGAMGAVVSYHEKLVFFFGFLQVVHILAFLWPSLFVSPMMVSTIGFLLDFCATKYLIH